MWSKLNNYNNKKTPNSFQSWLKLSPHKHAFSSSSSSSTSLLHISSNSKKYPTFTNPPWPFSWEWSQPPSRNTHWNSKFSSTMKYSSPSSYHQSFSQQATVSENHSFSKTLPLSHFSESLVQSLDFYVSLVSWSSSTAFSSKP